MNWIKTYLGQYKNQDIFKLSCKNHFGQQIEIFNFGGIVHQWTVPLKNSGKRLDILLGKNDWVDYTTDDANFGCIIGRYANRIREGHLKISEKVYLLSKNLNGHHLHGGYSGFGKKVWQIINSENHEDSCSVSMIYESPDGEEGYPGKLAVEVQFTFTQNSELIIRFTAKTDTDTVCNLTNHCYFNLGNKPNILDHQLQIFSKNITESDHDLIPTGLLNDIKNTAYDFSNMRKIDWEGYGEIPGIISNQGYDTNYVLENRDFMTEPVAVVNEEENRLTLEVFTSKPGLQLYTGNWLAGISGKSGTVYRKNAGICLESQFFPDSPNQATFPKTILKAGETYHHFIKYKLSSH